MLTTICLTLFLAASVIANIAQACEVGALRTLLTKSNALADKALEAASANAAMIAKFDHDHDGRAGGSRPKAR